MLKNRSSLRDMAPMSACLELFQINLYNRIFYANFYMRGSIKQIKTTGSVSLSKFNL